MNAHKSVTAILLCALLTGCHRTRSISNAAYEPSSGASAAAFDYRGEINEMDVLGLQPGQAISEDRIQSALSNAHPVALRPGDAILVVQSGAVFPDRRMVAELEKHFKVVPFSGSPAHNRTACFLPDQRPGQYAQMLRLAAAQAGAKAILCYWGVIESAEEDLPTKFISWIPIADSVLPDRKQHARLRLKVALVDVHTGSWSMFSPEAGESDGMTTRAFRASSDQRRVQRLKEQAYASTVRHLAEGYTR